MKFWISVSQQYWNLIILIHSYSLQRWQVQTAMSMLTTLTSNSNHSKYVWFISLFIEIHNLRKILSILINMIRVAGIISQNLQSYIMSEHLKYFTQLIAYWLNKIAYLNIVLVIVAITTKEKRPTSKKQSKHTTF